MSARNHQEESARKTREKEKLGLCNKMNSTIGNRRSAE
jgi:hypothetical protein